MATLLTKLKRKLGDFTHRIEKTFRPKGLILMYHCVGEHDPDPWRIRVSSKNLDEHLEVLKKQTHLMTLSEFTKAQRENTLPDRATAITFDDGYYNNLELGKPILQKHEAPATVFVTTNIVRKGNSYWWDDLNDAFLRPGHLPGHLSLKLNGHEHHWDLSDMGEYTEEQVALDGNIRPWLAEEGSRLYLFYSVWSTLQDYLPEQQTELVHQIREWAGAPLTKLPDHRRPMTPEELIIFEAKGLHELEAHTANHPMLSKHSLDFQRQEIEQSKRDLESILNHPVKHFAYPFGNFAPETGDLVEQADFESAVSTVAKSVWKKSGRFHLPRVEVTNFDGEEMEKRLMAWFRT